MSNELDRTLELWRTIHPRVERAIHNSATFLDGYPSGGGTPGATASGGRTQQVAERHLTTGDLHGDLRRDIERCVTTLADLVNRLAPNQATYTHLSTQVDGPAGCKSCARTGRWSEIHARGLCQNCPKLNRRVQGRYVWDDDMPPMQLVDMVARGVRVTDREIDRVMHGKKRRD